MSKFTRRDFIKGGANALGAGMMLPVLNPQAAGATIVRQLAEYTAGSGNILVIVELGGGIDGLNVIVPYQSYDTYASLRPTLGIPKDLLQPLYGSATMRMCPELALGQRALNPANPENGIKPLAEASKLAVIQGVGYPSPNLSHFTSRDIWYSATVDPNISTAARTGWIGRHSALFGDANNSLDTVGVGGAVNLTLYSSGAVCAGIANDSNGNPSGYAFNTDGSYGGDRNNQLTAARLIDAAASNSSYVDLWETTQLNAMDGADQVLQAALAYTSPVTYPTSNSFANGLKMIAKLATSTNPELGTRVYYISTGGFDTHANQASYANPEQPAGDLPRLLGATVAPALKAFYDDLVAHGLEQRVLILLWSEFGRRVAQNNNGTDHGTANNVMALGGRVKGGVYGQDPNLTDLDRGNLKFKIDFRAVYQTIIESWLGNSSAEAQQVLNGSFGNLGFIA
jgi:uncharacterized protein (DUF1501 family)